MWIFVPAYVINFRIGDRSIEEAVLEASWSAVSLPSITLCPGTQIKDMSIPFWRASYVFFLDKFGYFGGTYSIMNA